MVFGEWTFPIFILTHEPFVVFFLPCPAVKGSEREALEGMWHPDRVNPLQWGWGVDHDTLLQLSFKNCKLTNRQFFTFTHLNKQTILYIYSSTLVFISEVRQMCG